MCQIKNANFEKKIFTSIALEPIHIGTGASLIGRIDKTIVRDPVTNIPKIPGSSLAGVLRAYMSMDEGKYPACAGQGEKHCGSCIVCNIFGYSSTENGSFAGLVSFSDMHILLFPVSSVSGVQWVTSPMVLKRFLNKDVKLENENSIYKKEKKEEKINLGWLYLAVEKLENFPCILEHISKFIPDDKVCIVSDKLFLHIVNSNLEVRTSVAIDPATGTATDGALFTYEAIPAGTVLIWDIVCKKPGHFGKSNKISDIFQNINKSYEYMEYLGIGGMGTRGMGKMRVLNIEKTAQEATK